MLYLCIVPDIGAYPKQEIDQLFQVVHVNSDVAKIATEIAETNILQTINYCLIDGQEGELIQGIEQFYLHLLRQSIAADSQLEAIYEVWMRMKSFGSKLRQIVYQLDTLQIQNALAMRYVAHPPT